MTAQTSTSTNDLQTVWRLAQMPVIQAVGLGVIVLGFVFSTEVTAAIGVWYASTAYSHCFFVLPIAIYLGWERRHMLAGVRIEQMNWLVVGALPLSLAWLAAERLGIMEGRQLIAVAMLELLFLAVLGWQMFKALAAPLLYLFFLVPFGAFLTPALQDFTASFIDVGLRVLAIPHFSDAYIIEIPEGRFFVAEACAGLRFLIASIAFGVLYACLMYTSMSRRLAFIGASIVIPIVANGVRALGIVVLGHVLGSAEAAATDHVLYGWLFFSIVIMLLILAGLPFRQDAVPASGRTIPAPLASRASPSPGMAGPRQRALFVSVVGIGGIAALALGLAAWVDSAGDVLPPTPAARFAAPAGCGPAIVDSSAAGLQKLHFACPGNRLDVTVQTFSPRVNPARIMAALRRMTGEQEAEDPTYSNVEIPNQQPPSWRFVTTEKPARATATALWVDGQPAKGGLAGRLALARNSLFGAAQAPVLIAVSQSSTHPQLYPDEEQQIRARIAGFLGGQPALTALVGQLAVPRTAPAS